MYPASTPIRYRKWGAAGPFFLAIFSIPLIWVGLGSLLHEDYQTMIDVLIPEIFVLIASEYWYREIKEHNDVIDSLMKFDEARKI